LKRHTGGSSSSVQELREKAAKVAADDFAEKAAKAGKAIWEAAKSLAIHMPEIIYNTHKELNSSQHAKHLAGWCPGEWHHNYI
jgi:hypothetical protein